MLVFSFLIIRILSIQQSGLSVAANQQCEKEIILSKSRGYIYDRDYEPLVNNSSLNFSSFIKSDYEPFGEAENCDEKYNAIVKNGIVYNISEKIINNYSKNIVNYNVVERYGENQLCEHIIGYVDSDGYGVCGVEKAFDRILDSNKGFLSLKYKVDGNGIIIRGSGPELNNCGYDSDGGIVLTIDRKIQAIAENAISNSVIEKGAVVILKAETAEILASVSVPGFDADSVEDYLNNADSPLINRVISSYPVGSVFKPVIAASALKSGYKLSENYKCNGYCNIGNNIFNCYNTTKHGVEYLNDAMSFSCNLYFINLGRQIGADSIIDTASEFGFGKSLELCSSIIDYGGNLPDAEEITSDSQLANLCFGQGDLLASPLQVAAAYCVFANGGYYNQPILMKELVDDQKKVYGYYKGNAPVRVIDKSISEVISICLYNNMLNGTGINGHSDYVTSAGKTATAQTGNKDINGKEKLCTWFAGFVPYENPQYVIVVMNENGSAASSDCAPVFKNIVDELFKIQ